MFQNPGESYFETIDRLFDENRPKDAEAFMRAELDAAEEQLRLNDALVLLNELIGYYRQTSEKDQLHDVVRRAIILVNSMGLQGSIPYATTLVNAANACRSLGELENSQAFYEKAQQIYEEKIKDGELEKNDPLLAGLYNNQSLLCQERSDYQAAEQLLLKALAIVEANEAGFEIAVTYANLANTALLGHNYEAAESYAREAIRRFEARGLRDPHYCAALSALAHCCLYRGDKTTARSILTEAAHIIEATIGRNAQYERVIESIKLCD